MTRPLEPQNGTPYLSQHNLTPIFEEATDARLWTQSTILNLFQVDDETSMHRSIIVSRLLVQLSLAASYTRAALVRGAR